MPRHFIPRPCSKCGAPLVVHQNAKGMCPTCYGVVRNKSEHHQEWLKAKRPQTIIELTPEDIERFWSLIEQPSPDSCWSWTSAVDKNGYGLFQAQYKTFRVPRLAYEVWYQVCVLPKFEMCHTCDTPTCCNPLHLWVGTRKENHHDMMEKGRGLKGTHYRPRKPHAPNVP